MRVKPRYFGGLGAGQGRDAVPLSHMGYDVTAVDISQVGLEQIAEIDDSIKTINADVYTFDIGSYDVVLLDSMLHFYSRDLVKETNWVKQILENMKKRCCVCELPNEIQTSRESADGYSYGV